MARLLIAAALVLVTASAALAGTRLSEPAYIKAATKICKARTRQINALARLPKHVSTQRLVGRLRKVVPIYQRADRRFHALKVPHSLSYLVPQWLRPEDQRIEALKRALLEGSKGHRSSMFGYVDRSTYFGAQAYQQANNIGIGGCTS